MLAQVKNLPAPSPRAHSGSESEMEIEEFSGDAGAASGLDAMPGNADMVFDCIRVTWVVSSMPALSLDKPSIRFDTIIKPHPASPGW